jgi:lipopolysaccharide/colanic/teichoic acid biosynthesis glycosyltransferase
MLLKRWQDLPDYLKNDGVKKYYDYLYKKRRSLFAKRIFDLIASMLTLIILLPVIAVIGIAIKVSTKGPVIFRQTRVTQYGREFRIYKFCTMVRDADKSDLQVTTRNDARVTKLGRLLRKYRLDEIPQLINIITGDMTFVGTRPEVPQYIENYTDEMRATLLLPAGVTSETSILYKDEEQLLADALNANETYINVVLPQKMIYNLRSLEKYSFIGDIKTLFRTVAAVFRKGNKVSDNKNADNGRASMLQG